MKRQLTSLMVLSALYIYTPAISAAPLDNDASSSMVSVGIAKKIDLNVASIEELQTLPGVGISKAKAIIAYRQDVGPFLEVAQITEVKGIGEKMLSKLQGYVVVKD
ncbi:MULTISPECIES: ComEA family DNA-binding protein [Alteromonas]|jgi:competence protein ComEA|uniref:Competence protein n=1 Tax=Alteromonas stellipolaris TaxID=233316 RepID=A0AAW7Z7S8_9ALTE|nr:MULTISPECIES: helix-hairpin-helix domain-containing protein [Alteromonas]AMJ89836.1 competence protein [Alteromonas sp. Mac2]ALM91577.1 Late competence protein ComEA [Alteromonas stellipolaris LMG 21856]AMJ73544.1 competence protein [Alteromonas stellipolaris]AMJ85980.1 competence protein [Alteromonas sp. Mac1]AMJ93672.1 competence protein [Alteromonas stellipolaris]